MLYGETPTWHMHVGALMILDPSTARGGFGLDELTRLVRAVAAEVAPMRERLVEVPFGLDRPRWIEDPNFDPDAHVHRVALPAPGGPAELSALVGTLESIKLDRTRPLWEVWLIEGLADDRLALLAKIHHACADGVGSALLMGQLFSTEPTPAPATTMPAPAGEPAPSDARLVAEAIASLTTVPFRLARTFARTLRSVGRLARRPPGGDATRPALPFSAPRTPLNHPVSSRRSVAFISVPLADVKMVKDAFDAKVNDVVLALCGGALRRYLDRRGALPKTPLVAAVPVSLRTEDQLATLGNMVSGWFANLATDIADPVERLRAVRDGARNAKHLYETGVEDIVMDWADLPAPALWAAGVRLYVRSHLSERIPPIFNLLVSNVPGPAFPLYAGEARVEAIYPFGPVLDTIGLNITVLSYCDALHFGIVTCPELVPDVGPLARAIDESLTELVARCPTE
jgi:diacylglycerol O-acyltransferase / wax synthase